MVRFSVEKSSKIKPAKGSVYDGVWNKKQSKKDFFLSKFVEFCNRTDLHGYKYIVKEDFNCIERSCWALAVLLSIGIAAYFLITAYRWYARNPIVTVIESTQGAIWDVPFPAITICDLNVVSRKAARELANNLSLPVNVTADYVFKVLRLVPLLYATFQADPGEKDELYNLQTILDFNNITIESLFRRLSPASTCAHLVQRCMWKNSVYRCDDLFKQVFTLLGLCCTFNYFAVPEIEDTDSSSRLSAPRRVASCGYQTALTVLVYTNPDDYYSATVASQGVLVIIDNAYNIPDLDSPVRMVNPSTEVLIALSPERTYTTYGIKTFTPEERHCYYSDEVKIGNFQQYSYHNCIAYQKVQLLQKACQCAPVFFPLKEPYRICDFKDMDCIDNVFKMEEYLSRNGSENNSLFKCLPECEHYDYPLEVALGKLADYVYVNGLPFFDDVNLLNRSLLNVFFNDLVSTRFRRDVYLNWHNVLSAFGGLLSLMLGFTAISGVDFILFIIFRVAYTSCTSFFKEEKTRNKIHVQAYNRKKNKQMPPVYNQKAFDKYRSGYYDRARY